MSADGPPGRIPRWLAVPALLLVATVFGANHVAARIAFDHGTSVAAAVAARSLGTALLVLVLIVALRVPLTLPRIALARGLFVGLVLSVQGYFLYSAVARIPVALALLAFNTFPILYALLSWLTGGERPARRTRWLMPVVLTGLVLALDAGGWSRPGGSVAARSAEIGAGVAFALGASLCFASVMLMQVRWLAGVDGRVRTLLVMLVVAAVMIAGGLASDGIVLPSDTTGWIGLALLTVLYGSAITTFFVLLPRLGAADNAIALNFEPVAVLLLGWVVLDQRVAPLQLVGAAIVVGAIVALGAGARPAKKA